MDAIAFLRLGNTVLEAAIVILIASVLLYGIGSSIRNRVAQVILPELRAPMGEPDSRSRVSPR